MSNVLLTKLDAVRHKHAVVSVLQAAIGSAGLVVACIALGMLLDRWLELSYFVRVVLLSIDLAAAMTLLAIYAIMPVVRGPDVEQLALWVERDEPSFRSRLISVIQFGQPGIALAGASPAMVRALVLETEAFSAEIDFTRVVRTDRLTRLMILCGAVVVVVLAGAALAGRQSIALLERALLVPGVALPRRTQIDCRTRNLSIAVGDSLTIDVDGSGVIPASGELKIQYDSGNSISLPLEPKAGHPEQFVRPIDNVQESFNYIVLLGDNRSEQFRVQTVVRPSVLNLRCVQIYPKYTGLLPAPKSPWDLALLAGSRLAIDVKANKKLKISPDVHGNHIHLIGSNLDFPLMGDINDPSKLHAIDGTSTGIPIPAGTTAFTVELVDEDGIRSKDSVIYRIDLIPDRPPAVKLLAPVEKLQTVTAVARPVIEIQADDDFAVARLGLRYRITKVGQAAAVQDDPNGLTATYFNSLDLSGPGTSRTEPLVDVDWSDGTRIPGVGEQFSVRWAGQIRPPFTAQYRFKCLAGDGERVWVDGKLASQGWPHGGVNAEGPEIALQAGRLYPITIECRQEVGAAVFRLQWYSSKTGAEVIPHSALFHRSGPLPEAAPDADGLVGYWPFDGDNEGFAHDLIAEATGTVYNAVHADGKIGQAMAFQGGDQRIEIANNEAMNFHADESFTLSAWVNLKKGVPRWQAVITKTGDGGGAWYGIWIDASGHFVAISPNHNLQGGLATPGWHLVTVVQDAAAHHRTILVDGIAGQTTRSMDASSGGDLVIGSAHGNSAEPFNGLIDDVRLYARPLPAVDIQQMLNDPRPVAVPKLADLVAAPGGNAETVDLGTPDQPARSFRRKIVWDLSKLVQPLTVGDTVEFWADAADNNNITGPGIGSSEHHQFTVISEADKQKELMDRLGDYMAKVRDVSDNERDLNAKTGSMVGPGNRK